VGTLIYSMSVSLDGYVARPDGSLDWVLIDDTLHSAFNEEARSNDVFLYGRRMYELMAGYWPTADSEPGATPVEVEFAQIWKDTPKVVFSRSLERVDFNSRLVRGDAVEEVTRLKAQPGFEMGVGGPTTAAPLIRAGLVDEYRLALHPVVLGAGIPFFPDGNPRRELRLLDERRLASGVVLVRYAPVTRPS
jgi:dihydrofolate reductase